MEMSQRLSLIPYKYEADGIGQQIKTEQPPVVIWCDVQSVSQAEWMEAGRNGLNAEYRATVYADEYSNEEEAEIDGKRYGIYRTFRRKSGYIELYLERKVGLNVAGPKKSAGREAGA